MKCLVLAWLLLSPFVATTARATIAEVMNTVRGQDCGPRTLPTLQLNAELNRAAQRVAAGAAPSDAAHTAGYQATQLAVLHFSGYDNEAKLRALLRQRYCAQLGDAHFLHMGITQRGRDTWVVLGAPLIVPRDPHSVSERVLQLVNEARARPHRCGTRTFAATTALVLNTSLETAARLHSQEMARYSYMDHQGRDGSTPAQRVTRAGYAWSHVGENVAAGSSTADEVMSGWLNSPGHCANIMDPGFTQMAVAYASATDDYGIYWTQVFATPRHQ